LVGDIIFDYESIRRFAFKYDKDTFDHSNKLNGQLKLNF